MDVFLRGAALALLTAVLILMLGGSSRGIGQMLSILACCMVIMLAAQQLSPVLELIALVRRVSGVEEGVMEALLKVVGISLTAEIAALVCNDSGNAALGKALEVLSWGAVLQVSAPMLTSLFELIEGLIGSL